MQCKYCGYTNEDTTRFCVMCGKALTPQQSMDVSAPPLAPPAQARETSSSQSPPQSEYTPPPPPQAEYTPPPPPQAEHTPPPSPQAEYTPPPPPSSSASYTPTPPPLSQAQHTPMPMGMEYSPAQPPISGTTGSYHPSSYQQVPPQPHMPTNAPSYPYPMPPQQVVWADDLMLTMQTPKGKKKRKKKKGKIIGLSFLVVFLLLIAGVLIYSLPLKSEIELEGTRHTIDGTISDLSLSIKTNQLIRQVSYALDPSDPADSRAYTPLENLEGGLFKKTGRLPRLKLDKIVNESSWDRGPWKRSDNNAKIGNHVLYITVKTLFGTSDPIPFNLHYASGISALPDRSKIKRISDETIEKEILTNELLVSLQYGSDRFVAEALARATGGKIVGEIPSIFRYQFRYEDADKKELETILNKLLESPDVTGAQYNYIYNREETQFYPNDKKFDSWDVGNPDGNNWGLEVIRAPLVWKDIDRLTPISVGIADGGLEYDHEDLGIDRSNIYLFPTYTMETLDDLELYYQKSKKSEGSDYFGKKEHGTHVTGIIAELGDNEIGAAGVNWNTVPYFFHYWHMDVNEDTGELDMWNVTTSFELELTLTTLVEQGCRVINFSVGDTERTEPGSKHEYIETQAYGDLCLRLEQQGYDFLVFKAAGNAGYDASDYAMNRIMKGSDPARRHTVIVASIDNTEIDYDNDVDPRIKYAYRLSDFSNYGDIVDIAAPGTDIFSTVPDQGYKTKSGTSMASPMAAGVASLIYGAHPEYYASQVKAILMEETDTFTTDGINLIPVVNAALSGDYARRGDTPQLPPGQVIPNPAVTPYPGPPTPTDPKQPTPPDPEQPTPPDPDTIQLPDHTPFRGESGKGGFTGFVCDAETKNAIALFTLHVSDQTLDYAYPYPASYDAQKMGEFFTRVLAEDGKDTTVDDLVIEARGYKPYEVPPFTVRGGEVTDLGKLYLDPEDENQIRIPGHTPFPSKEGWGGFVGFVYDDETKTPIPDFTMEGWLKPHGMDKVSINHDFNFPPSKAKFAQLKGEYMVLVNVQGTENTVRDLKVHADGYVSANIGDVHVRSGVFTDAGVIYLKRGVNPPEPTEPKPTEPQPSDPKPTEPQPTAPVSGKVESITLEWGASPDDLDLHLTAPFGGAGESFHIFAHEGYRSYDWIDDVDVALTDESSKGYGPEVITVNELAEDIPFTVYVHDFSNVAKKSGIRALADSGATVSIKFKGVTEPLVFQVPSEEGTLWKVCTIYEGKVTGVNEMSYEGRPLNIGANDDW